MGLFRPVVGWRGLVVLLTQGRWRWVRRLAGGYWELWWCDKPIAAHRWFPVKPGPGRPTNHARRRPLRREAFVRIGGKKTSIIAKMLAEPEEVTEEVIVPPPPAEAVATPDVDPADFEPNGGGNYG